MRQQYLPALDENKIGNLNTMCLSYKSGKLQRVSEDDVHLIVDQCSLLEQSPFAVELIHPEEEVEFH